MKTVFFIDGGAGRIVASIPAFIKYAKNHKNEDWAILVVGLDYMFWGIEELQDRTYNIDTKGVFDNVVKNADKFITPEPYRNPAYFNQKISLAQAFDQEINNTTDHSDLGNPVMVFNKQETLVAKNTITEVKKAQKHQKTIIIQPFGRGAKIVDNGDVSDEESRSMSVSTYLSLTKRLTTKYNIIFFGEPEFQLKQDNIAAKFTCDLRQWGALIKESDYFIGVDSVGQHMARAVGTKGTVLIGSTFAINTTYPDYFNVIEKKGVKKYSPIRISGLDVMLANRLNESLMEYSEKEVTELYTKIVTHIEGK